MGFNFSFFGKQEVRKFSYKPRFYDPETEARREKYGDFTKKKDEQYVPGCHLKGSLRDGNYRQTKDMSKNQKVLGAISLLLLFAVIFLMWKYFPKLLESLEQTETHQEFVQDAPYADAPEDEYKIVSIK